jgi:xanthine phosphoribosyltransferase
MSDGEKAKLSLIVSWDDFHRHTIQLAHMIQAKGMWKAVAGISRGGLTPASIVARELDIRMVSTIGIASYHDYKTQGELKMLTSIAPEVLEMCPKGEGLVIVDDLLDTGNTFRKINLLLPKAHRAAVFAKRPALDVDTHFITIPNETWIYLPWDTQPGSLQLRPTVIEELALLAKKDPKAALRSGAA